MRFDDGGCDCGSYACPDCYEQVKHAPYNAVTNYVCGTVALLALGCWLFYLMAELLKAVMR